MARNLLITALTLLLVACGGGSPGSESTVPEPNPSPTPSPAPTPTEHEVPAGLWFGTSTYLANNATFRVGALIAPSGEVHFIADDGEQVRGMLTSQGQNISGEALFFDDVGLFIRAGTISGSYTEEAISADVSVDGTLISQLSFAVDPMNRFGASLERLEGTYATQDQSISFVADDAGAISGSDNDGCVYTGDVKVPDPQINIFEVSLEIENCDTTNGIYTGLAALGVEDANGLTPLLFQVDNQKIAITNVFFK